ncbi:hypothetical protein N8K70_11450 [Microbacterium betulae]|uniref:Uncharacterized protein n=1 Tax=Microbacterium betulae TaxID=2981139 RepID=A0AA97I3Y3_9MICO|nr:hypothetical protein [Microbacterium sp. AB]WOF21991.1 hypothetical protein N8K70_11450 [Microbacterium sp. AB]
MQRPRVGDDEHLLLPDAFALGLEERRRATVVPMTSSATPLTLSPSVVVAPRRPRGRRI